MDTKLHHEPNNCQYAIADGCTFIIQAGDTINIHNHQRIPASDCQTTGTTHQYKFTHNVNNLDPDSTYYYCAYTQQGDSSIFSQVQKLTLEPETIVVRTLAPHFICAGTAEVLAELNVPFEQGKLRIVYAEGRFDDFKSLMAYQNKLIGVYVEEQISETETKLCSYLRYLKSNTEYSYCAAYEYDNRLVPGEVMHFTTKSTSIDIEQLNRAGLTRLYNTAGGENWTNKTNWLSNEPLCHWYGIRHFLSKDNYEYLYGDHYMLEDDQEYWEASLNNLNLTGNAEIEVYNCRYLNLTDNNLTGLSISGLESVIGYIILDNNPIKTFTLNNFRVSGDVHACGRLLFKGCNKLETIEIKNTDRKKRGLSFVGDEETNPCDIVIDNSMVDHLYIDGFDVNHLAISNSLLYYIVVGDKPDEDYTYIKEVTIDHLKNNDKFWLAGNIEHATIKNCTLNSLIATPIEGIGDNVAITISNCTIRDEYFDNYSGTINDLHELIDQIKKDREEAEKDKGENEGE